MHVTVIGTGYVGLVAGACFADKGCDVVCIDIDEEKINSLNEGKIPIYEPGLKEIIENAVKRNHISFSSDLKSAILKSRAIFICVGTPESKNGDPDMSAVWAVSNSIGLILKNTPNTDTKVIVTKSTVPVGTGDEIEKILSKYNLKKVEVASNPEFLKEGDAIHDFESPDRVVIGTGCKEAQKILTELYSPFTVKSDRIMCMDRRSAEMTKYAANSMLALRISFINQIANLCERVGANVTNVRKGIGSDSRIGNSFLFPGPGYGGSCFPKDIKALIALGRANNFPLSIMESVDEFNQKQKHIFAEKIIKHFGDMTNRTIAIWGLSFKPETDDIREAAAIFIIKDLIAEGANVKAYDPEATENFRKELDNSHVTYCNSMYDAVKGADALVLVTDWNEFKRPDFPRMKELMKTPLIFDTRNLYGPIKMTERGFKYVSNGRRPVL